MSSSTAVRILDTAADLFQAAAEDFAALAADAVRRQGRFCVALSGGSTPRGLYTVLASGAFPSIPWDKICFFWGDERHAPPDHPDSNYRMANESLLSKVPVRPENIFRIHAEEKDASVAAEAYEQTLRTFFGSPPGRLPRFDLILLGLGPEGHIASLFPDTTALQENKRWVVANWVEKLKTDRITFTLPVLNNAAYVAFLAGGAEKAAIVREVLENPAADLPAQKINPTNGTLVWMLDHAAAGALSKRK